MREEADGILYPDWSERRTERSTTQYQTSPRLTFLEKKRTKKFNMCRQEEGEPVDLFTTSPASPARQNIATISRTYRKTKYLQGNIERFPVAFD